MDANQSAVFGEVQKNWKWMLFLGIIFVVIGFVGLGRTFALTIASVFFFGILLLPPQFRFLLSSYTHPNSKYLHLASSNLDLSYY